MYILMCGTGVGFSVEEKYVSQLPRITETFEETDTTIVVEDSKEGWCKPSVNYSLYSLLVESPDGMCHEYDLLVHDSRRLEEELQDPSLLFDFLTLVSTL
jgi:hypothetical protein